MTYHGRVQNGVVILDKPGCLPEGVEVRIEVSRAASRSVKTKRQPRQRTLGERLMKFAGKAKGLPPDLARNLDHYLYGLPKE